MLSLRTHRRRSHRSQWTTPETSRLWIEPLEPRLVLANDIGFAEPVAYPVGNNPEGLAAGDVNGDGHSDLVTANFADSSVSFLMGNADATFAPAVDLATDVNPIAVTVADVDRDGGLDVVTANFTANSVTVLFPDPDPLLGLEASFAAGVEPFSVMAADVNGDDNLDLIVPHTGSPNISGGISVLYGVGFGGFQRPVEFGKDLRPVSVAIADLNDDGHLDIAAANGFVLGGDENNDIAVLLGAGNGTFGDSIRYTAGDRPTDIAAADVNSDGVVDLVAVNAGSNDVSVFLGVGGGTLATAVNYDVGLSPNSLVVSDFNGNGHLDIAVANGESNDITVLVNQGDGTFVPRGRFASGINPLSIVAAHFNDDQLPDLAVVTQEPDQVLVLLNTPVELAGTVELDGRGAVYEQNFDAALGVSGAGVPLPAGWSFQANSETTASSITRSFPGSRVADGTYNAGRNGSTDRALALGTTSAEQQNELQFIAQVTGGDARAIRLAFDIEAWQADLTLAANPGEAAFNVILEADTGAGFEPVVDFGRVSTGPTVRPPSGPLGTELWKTDGTNVSLVADLVPGEQGSFPGFFVNYNDAIYFWAGNSIMYRFDGSELSVVTDLEFHRQTRGNGGFVLSDTLYYDILLPTGDMFLKIDETGVTRIPNVENVDLRDLPIVYNDELYFNASEVTQPDLGVFPEVGRELWKFDGNDVVLVADINPRSPKVEPNVFSRIGDSDPREFTILNDTLYFTAGPRHPDEREIWKTDGTTVELLTDIFPGTLEQGDGGGAEELTLIDNVIYFRGNDGATGRELWKFDGINASQIADINPGRGSAFRSSSKEGVFHAGFTGFNGEVYFVADDGQSGRELWKTDGSTVGRLTDINPGSGDSMSRGSSRSSPMIAFNDHLYFAAKGATGGFGLWKTDGVAMTEVANLNPQGDFLEESSPSRFFLFDGELYFLADDGHTGRELWKTNGTDVVRVTDINSGPGDAFERPGNLLRQFVEFNGELYFAATNGDGLTTVLDGESTENRIQFDSGPVSANIREGATIRLRFSTSDANANVGYVVGLDNVEFRLLAAGDSDGNGQFDQLDIVTVLQAGKYLTGQPATFAQGDWNRDGVFNQMDIVAALQTNNYLQGPYALFAARDNSVRGSGSDGHAAVDDIFRDDVMLDDLIKAAGLVGEG